jgi:hypothetical protein
MESPFARSLADLTQSASSSPSLLTPQPTGSMMADILEEPTERVKLDKGKEREKETAPQGKSWVEGLDYAYEYVAVTQVS